jgi:hypothetical protein
MLCFRFDEDDPDDRPLEHLDLEYSFNVSNDEPREISFSYRNCSLDFTFTLLQIHEEKGLYILPCTLSRNNH